ncbi:hypothetical protein QMO14_09930 [Variovorax sp. CAN2819]|uniref:hypothetical protein n=1 Tax=Variovorax sp. CAN15 TaxID=3046727 RepID=UPI0026492B5D|nr:hypothetical protein [Variovorax sp. CAN15]MDN6883914.1 hypothetical protein [Variovorax sp. CAN15]
MREAIAEFAPGVTFAATVWGDEYTGKVDALLEAGLVQPHQLPGAPGNGRTMVSFYPDGRRVGKGNSTACKQQGYLKVSRASLGCVRVLKGVGTAEEKRRRDAYKDRLAQEEAKAFALAHSWPFPVVYGRPV